jgi:hypothetical protein
MKLCHMVFLVAGLLSVQAWAQPSGQSKGPSMVPKVAFESPTSSSDLKKHPEVIALDEQNKLIKQYHSSLLDTVYFALSLVGGVAALLVGASFLINFKLYESDKERFNEKVSSLKADLESLRKSQLDAIASFRSEVESNTTAQIEKAKAEIVVSVQRQMETYADRASTEMMGLRSEVLSATERNEGTLQSVMTKLGSVQATEQNLRRKIASAEMIAREAEAATWDIRKFHGPKLMTLCQAIEASIEADKGWNVEMLLEEIVDTLSDYIDSGKDSMGTSAIDMVKRIIKRTASSAEETSSKVLALITKIENSSKTNSA